jgi:hypothetical protein
VFLAAGAAVGVSGRSPRVIGLAAALVAVDAIGLGEAPWPRASYEMAVPKQVLAIPGDGPLLLLPFAPAEEGPVHRAWQPLIGRALADHYEGPTAVRRIPWVAWVESRCGNLNPPAFDPQPPASRPSAEEIAAAVAEIRRTFEVVAVVLPQTHDAERCLAELEMGFGPADRSIEGTPFWRQGG